MPDPRIANFNAERFSRALFDATVASTRTTFNAQQTMRDMAAARVGRYRLNQAILNVRERTAMLLALARNPDYPFDRFDVAEWCAQTVQAVLALTEARR